ncbi:type II toxin-antitoxin system VapC family toxin [Candidatus Woesebacteria bacterium]|nr:type II toxin-antitoxin system VapC family toxin [Candidatus Woesebacteria bacterium]
MVILDTNLIIDHLRQVNTKQETRLIQLAREYHQEQLGISMISVQELYEGKSVAIQQGEQQLLAIISSLKIFSYTLEIAKKAGEIARELSQPIEFADVAIAATCIVNHAGLATLNEKHFLKIPQLQLVK